MQLKSFTDLSLRTLLYVGMQGENLSTIGAIADFFHISKEHLRKVVHRLSSLGYLHTTRGIYGGMQLAMAADQIRLGKVVALMEEDMSIIDCEGRQCTLTGRCKLKGVLMQAQQAFLQVLDQYTLADVLSDPLLQQQLRIELHAVS
ncbi:hypothetical protein WH50_10845 [Pokkaliibacter plantistimulans]|uniref:Rrf2 family transcriptional regulator n=1 Tax=Pokkaliibacter plantistimulans TaxID=1635171 RepID=A0ABX5M119_9GAMM|nr:Rrf2 family transcriptional regulator [Pokkaliibacter plantistimulans]PXF31266.1 hypothetical protein WH50_10845 [Pokkaliibacter plantistimulans]